MPPLSLLRSKVSREGHVIDPYRSIFENAIEGIFQSTPAGQYINVNPALAKMYGYDSPGDLIQQLTHIDDQLYVDPTRRKTFVEAMELHGFVRGFESEIHRKNGSIIWISENARAVLAANGTISYYEGMVEDITERKRLEENMSRVTRQMQALLESAGDGIYGMDSEGRCTFMNRAGSKLLGYFPNQLLGQHMHSLVHHHRENLSAYPEEECPILCTFQTNKPCRVNNEVFWRSDGTSIPVEYTCYPIIENEVTNGAVITFSDITERRRAEEQIAEQAELLDKAQDAIIVCDLGGVILFWNKGAESVYGWHRHEAVGKPVGDLIYPDPVKFQDASHAVLSRGEWFGEIQHLTKDRRELNIQARWTLVRDKEGGAKSILAINTDITEKKKIEAQFMRAQRMEGIGTLAGGIAHDLNNILTPIMLSIETLKATSTDHRATGILETIEVSAKRGADIVRQVLSFARGVEGERVEVQPRRLLKDIQTLLKDTFPKNIRMELFFPSDGWTILGDPTQLHQVLLNLCINARDAMPEGGNLTITVENVKVDEQYAAMDVQAKVGRYVIINVVDSGVGIPPVILDKIFDPFFTTKAVGEGTGLGLSTVMTIIKSHEGFVNVYSEPERGTTFKVYLPALDISPATRKQQSGKLFTLRGEGETVLVVDDELSILNITGQTLDAFGYRVLTATDGANALGVYLEHKDEIALVLTDMSMPVMDGASFIRALLKLNPAIKIIAASGLDAEGGVIRGALVGIKHFLTKPFTAGTLLKSVRTVLDSPL
jgi:PAS domain S-box-containing protein